MEKELEKIKAKRLEYDISYNQMGFKLAIPSHTYLYIENGIQKPTERQLREISEILDIPLEDLGLKPLASAKHS